MSDGPSQLVVDPRDEQLIHRLEAFSDIVIGFSLALLAINLTAPANVAGLATQATATALVTFFVCFGLIAFLWWFHNRIFAHFFVATGASIVLNFAVLVGIVLLVYSAQIVSNVAKVKPFDVYGYFVALSLWLAIYGVVLMLLGGMTVIGLRARWGDLSDAVRRWGLKQCVHGLVGGTMMLVIAMLIPRVPIVYAGFVSILAVTTLIVERYAVPRLLARGNA